MIDAATIRKDMPVIASDGDTLGEVDGVEGIGQDARIKMKRNTSPDGHHHYVALSDVARVDEHVHLNRSASDVRAGWMLAGEGAAAAAGTGTTGAAAHGAREVHVEGGNKWLPWILGALALFALLVFGLRSCDNVEPAAVAPTADNEVPAAPAATDVEVAVAEQSVTLPGGNTVMLAPQTIGYDLQRYLASAEPAPRRFEFERLNFDTASAELRVIDRPTVDGLAKILAAYPAARVQLVGYADARGETGANADLGTRRAQAVATALVTAGIAADRIETATGGEGGATDTNASARGQAMNRRTELVVLAK